MKMFFPEIQKKYIRKYKKLMSRNTKISNVEIQNCLSGNTKSSSFHIQKCYILKYNISIPRNVEMKKMLTLKISKYDFVS